MGTDRDRQEPTGADEDRWGLMGTDGDCTSTAYSLSCTAQVAKAAGKHINTLRDAATQHGMKKHIIVEDRAEVLRLFKSVSDVNDRSPSISIMTSNMAARLLRKMKLGLVADVYAALRSAEPPTNYHQPGIPATEPYVASAAGIPAMQEDTAKKVSNLLWTRPLHLLCPTSN